MMLLKIIGQPHLNQLMMKMNGFILERVLQKVNFIN